METPKTPPAQTPSTGSGNAAPTDGLAATIAGGAAGQQPPATAGDPPAKNKGGRPAIHGAYSKAAGSNGKNPVKPLAPSPGGNPTPTPAVAPPAPPRVVIPQDLLSKVVQSTITLVENGLANAIEGKAIRAGLTPAEIDPQLSLAQLPVAEKKLVGDLAPYVAQEWGLDPNLSPTVAVAMILTPWGFGALTAFLTLSTLAKEKAARDAKRKPAPPGPEVVLTGGIGTERRAT